MKTKTLSLIAVSLLFFGCSPTQPTPQMSENNITKTPSVVIDSEAHIKKAIVLLISKTEQLEAKLASNEGAFDDNSTSMIIKMNDDIAQLQRELKQRSLSPDLNDTNTSSSDLVDMQRRMDEIESRLTSSGNDGSSCQIVTYAMRSSGEYRARKEVNIRSCPMINSTVIGKIKSGQIVEFVGCDRYGWCKLNGQDGYVSGIYFDKKRKSAPSIKSALSGDDDAVIQKYINETSY